MKLVVKGRANLLQPALLPHAKKLWCVSLSYFREDSSLLWKGFIFVEFMNNPAAKNSSCQQPPLPLLKVGSLALTDTQMEVLLHTLDFHTSCKHVNMEICVCGSKKEFAGTFKKVLGLTYQGVALFSHLIPLP